MIFDTAYYHPMDRDYHPEPIEGAGVKDVGMSVPLGIAAGDVHGVAAKIRSGAGSLEIGFPGAVRGQRQQQTPGMWGFEQRQALREMADVNKVNLTTHASYGIGGMAGQDQQGNFSDEYRKTAVDEIKRAIEFAADVAKGGSVVVHTGEYIRPISEEPWAAQGKLFKQYEEEPERAIVRLVDDRTGQVLQQIRKNQIVARAVWNKSDRDFTYVSEVDNPEIGVRKGDNVHVRKGDYIDYENKKVSFDQRVPEYNPETNSFNITRQTWDDFVEEARIRNEQLARERKVTVSQLRSLYPDEYRTPEEAFMAATTESQERVALGWAGQYSRTLKDNFKNLEMVKKAKDYWDKLEASIPEDEKWKIMERDQPMLYGALGKVAEFLPKSKGAKTPSELLDNAMEELRNEIKNEREMVTGQLENAETQRILRDHAVSARKYALKRSYESYADAGMHAFYQTQAKRTEKPLIITMENIFPEQYGGHPEELRDLIYGARKQMANKLAKKGYSEQEAEKIAANHIKCTIDTGHMNMWRKYWQGSDKEFDKWFLKESEELAKEGLIGNVHLTDNYGYQDDHLAPGQGNTPVRAFVKVLKKHGYDGAMTVEPGADASTDLGDFHGLAKTWRYFGSPVYGLASPHRVGAPARNWTDVQYGYFGRTYPPYFIFGAYSPSNDWQLWSGTPME
ncbi:hypothetical protein GF351_02615 [Candidatus Woesearchaeota archaeon]|nr:hypothetical protein [Candidatus Woesearchaeota archaeon]